MLYPAELRGVLKRIDAFRPVLTARHPASDADQGERVEVYFAKLVGVMVVLARTNGPVWLTSRSVEYVPRSFSTHTIGSAYVW
jgi:hypothetical protein